MDIPVALVTKIILYRAKSKSNSPQSSGTRQVGEGRSTGSVPHAAQAPAPPWPHRVMHRPGPGPGPGIGIDRYR